MNDPSTGTKVWGLTVGAGGGMGRGEKWGINWDNCNKMTIKKSLKKENTKKVKINRMILHSKLTVYNKNTHIAHVFEKYKIKAI